MNNSANINFDYNFNSTISNVIPQYYGEDNSQKINFLHEVITPFQSVLPLVLNEQFWKDTGIEKSFIYEQSWHAYNGLGFPSSLKEIPLLNFGDYNTSDARRSSVCTVWLEETLNYLKNNHCKENSLYQTRVSFSILEGHTLKFYDFSIKELLDYPTLSIPLTSQVCNDIKKYSDYWNQYRNCQLPGQNLSERKFKLTAAELLFGPSTDPFQVNSVQALDNPIESTAPVLPESSDAPAPANETHQTLQTALDACFLKAPHLWINALKPGKGYWRFDPEYFNTPYFLDALAEFLKINSVSPLNLHILQEWMKGFFKFSIKSLSEILSGSPIEITPLGNQEPIHSPFPDPLLDQLLPVLINTKLCEWKHRPQMTQSIQSSSPRSVPGIAILNSQGTASVVFLLAHFDAHGMLDGFSQDLQQLGKQYLRQKNIIDFNFEDDNDCTARMEWREIVALQHGLSKDQNKKRIPEFLVFESTSILSSEELKPQTHKGKKRPNPDMLTSDSQIAFKKQKVTQNSAETELNNARTSEEVTLTKDRLKATTYELNWDNLWNRLNVQVLENTAQKIKPILDLEKDLASITSLHLPIVDKLELLKTSSPPLIPLHPQLKPYQAQAAEKVLRCFRNGLSPLLALEMGTGKSWVINEVVAQLIHQGAQGSFIIVLPKSVCEQFKAESQRYRFALAILSGLNRQAALQEIQRQDFLKELLDTVTVFLNTQNAHGLAASLPLLASYAFTEVNAKLKSSLLNVTEQFWVNFFPLLSDLMRSFVDQIPEEIINEARAMLVDNCLTQEKNRQDDWNTYFSKTSVSDLISESIPRKFTIKFPVALGKMLFAGTLMKLYFQPQCTQTDSHALCSFSSKDTVNCGNKQALIAALKQKTRIVVCSYEAFKNASGNDLNKYPIACIVFDEAQKMHTSNSQLSLCAHQMVKSLKNTQPNLPVLLSTATPFENKLSELWTLIEIGNADPIALPGATFQQVTIEFEIAQEALLEATNSPNQNPRALQKVFLESFALAEAFRAGLSPLIERKKRTDPQVIAEWGGAGPQRKDVEISAKVSEFATKKLDKALEDFRSNKDQLSYAHKVNRILLHPQFEQETLEIKDENIKKIIKSLDSPESIKEFINKSPRLSNLFENEAFLEMINNREKGLVFSEYLVEAHIIAMAINTLYENQAESQVFSGEVKTTARNALVQWFKEDSKSEKTKVLILLKKAGGVGLNLPEASKVFRLSENWNPFVDAQAEDRANRVNKAGLRTFVSFTFNTFHCKHLATVREVKRAMEEFFLSKEGTLEIQFTRFCQLILNQCIKNVLNSTKNLELANQKQADMESLIQTHLLPKIQKKHLESFVNARTPKPRYPSFISCTTSGVIPLLYKTSFNEAIRFASHASTEAQTTSKILQKLASRPQFRELFRLGIEENGLQDENDLGLKIEIHNLLCQFRTGLPHNLDIDTVRANHTLVIYKAGINGYALDRITNPGKKSSLFLYEKVQRDGSLHYDVFIPQIAGI